MATVETSRGERHATELAAELERIDHDVDQRAERIRGVLSDDLATVEEDGELTAIAKRERGDAARTAARDRMVAVREDYGRRREDAIASTTRRVLGGAPTDSAALVAFRDAGARAAALPDPREAQAALREALDVGDRQQAEAILRRALHQGWRSVWQAHPDAPAFDMLAELQPPPRRNPFRFAI